MLAPQIKEQIALKKFSLISPVVNGQVQNQTLYFKEICSKPIEMPHYGIKVYSPKTISHWLSDYRRGGFDALKPGSRSDEGKSRKISPELEEQIKQKLQERPRAKASVLYDELLDEGIISRYSLSKATFYRYLQKNPLVKQMAGQEKKERKRFSYQNINELWQGDLMFGPHLQVGRQKKQVYLISFIDDASRLIPFSMFSFSQNFLALRLVLKEAVARRGIPKLLYTDNGKIYKSQQLSLICARIGCTLLHAQPFDPRAKGKIERHFNTVRTRFLDRFDISKSTTIEQLNEAYWKWLDEDYHRKTHSSINCTPLDYFMSQANLIKMITDPTRLDELFFLRAERKVLHDATLSVENTLYETEQSLAGERVEVRYEPEWIGQAHYTLPLYMNDCKVGEARLIDQLSNAKAKRRGVGRPWVREDTSEPVVLTEPPPPQLSFSRLYGQSKDLEE